MSIILHNTFLEEKTKGARTISDAYAVSQTITINLIQGQTT